MAFRPRPDLPLLQTGGRRKQAGLVVRDDNAAATQCKKSSTKDSITLKGHVLYDLDALLPTEVFKSFCVSKMPPHTAFPAFEGAIWYSTQLLVAEELLV